MTPPMVSWNLTIARGRTVVVSHKQRILAFTYSSDRISCSVQHGIVTPQAFECDQRVRLNDGQ
jgi:hypothetical protein